MPIAGSPAQAAPFATQAGGAGLTRTQTVELQSKVDDLIKQYPGSRQVSANKIAAKGFDIVVQAPGQKAGQDLAKPATKLALGCNSGYLCMEVGGTVFNLYACQTWYATNWYGTGEFVNNQSPGTVASFYTDGSGALRWTSTAYEAGHFDATPIGSVRPC
ncbi:hypothetical protein VV02_23530 [Luteipulveratus mongoliensis]|uniref:Uncharacterized protein n=2 Tax=Luteipulveratus mongoliensis TaxID=571913 RepID=A0A0K1JRA2_9MICO|nr:hypothetical protein VV02_23530 [Luteipulveratus mongoliensis]